LLAFKIHEGLQPLHSSTAIGGGRWMGATATDTDTIKISTSVPQAQVCLGHERRFRSVHDASGLPPTPERLRQRNEPTLRANKRPWPGNK